MNQKKSINDLENIPTSPPKLIRHTIQNITNKFYKDIQNKILKIQNNLIKKLSLSLQSNNFIIFEKHKLYPFKIIIKCIIDLHDDFLKNEKDNCIYKYEKKILFNNSLTLLSAYLNQYEKK